MRSAEDDERASLRPEWTLTSITCVLVTPVGEITPVFLTPWDFCKVHRALGMIAIGSRKMLGGSRKMAGG